MAYIYKKTIQGKPYYYLRISQRINGKIIVKDIAYLGSDTTQIGLKLDKLPKIYKKEIRKAKHNLKKFVQSEHYLKKAGQSKLKENPYLDRDLLKEIEALKLHFNERFLHLDRQTVEETYKNFLIEFAFNTASIEGNTITLAETERLLRENLTPKNRTVQEIHDLQNTEKAFFYLLNNKHKIDPPFIIFIHDQLMENIDQRKGYRTHDVRVFHSRFVASPVAYIQTDMHILLEWYEKNKEKLHPFVVASLFHQKFEKIHPFADGNGRTGRMLMNYMLLQKKYPPLIVRKSQRAAYLDALATGDKISFIDAQPQHFKHLVTYLAKELTNGYWNTFLM